MIFDLHVHTTFSDGLLSPEEMVKLAYKKNIDGIAITDHDTILGIEPAIKYGKEIGNISIIPGIEFSCIYKDEEVHILGYFIDYTSQVLIDITNNLRKNRIARIFKMLEKINKLGMELTFDEVKAYSKAGYMGRPHVARALVDKGYVDSIHEAFEKYISRGKPGYVERNSLKIEEAINLIHNTNGIAVLAHPGLLKDKKIIDYCINLGIDGIEVIHSKHKKEDVNFLIDICKRSNLIITGGSDCHGKLKSGDYLLGNYYVNIDHIPIMKGRL